MPISGFNEFDPRAAEAPSWGQISGWCAAVRACYLRVVAALGYEGEALMSWGFVADPESLGEIPGPPERGPGQTLLRSGWKPGKRVFVEGQMDACKVTGNFLIDIWRGRAFINVVTVVRPRTGAVLLDLGDGISCAPSDLRNAPIAERLRDMVDPSVLAYIACLCDELGGWTPITSLEFMSGMPAGSTFAEALKRLNPLAEHGLIQLQILDDNPATFYFMILPAFADAFVRE